MAVYTPLANEQISALLKEQYGLGRLAFAVGITQGVENTNYLVAVRTPQGGEQKYILTLYEKRMNPKELPFFIDLMYHLAAKGISCPQPIARLDGALFGMVAGKQAALVSFVEGKSRSVLTEAHVASVGDALAGLHLAAQDFTETRANTLSIEGWKTLYEKLRGKLDSIEHGLDALVADELEYLAHHWPVLQELQQGVVHADLFPDNVFFVGDAVSGIIDFYFACDDVLAYDIAVTINAWCFELDGAFNAAKAAKLLAEYQKKRALSDEEKNALPTLLRGAALRFFFTRAHDWIHREPGANVVVKDPLEYSNKLRFHRGSGWQSA